MKQILKVILLALFAFQVSAQVTTSGTLAAATTTVVSAVPGTILSLTLYDISGTATNDVIVYDLASDSSTNLVRPAFTAAGQHTTNRVTTYTSSTGVSVSFTNTVLFPYTVVQAATTNEANRVLTTRLPANGSFEAPAAILPLGTSRGIAIRPVGTANYTITFVPQN